MQTKSVTIISGIYFFHIRAQRLNPDTEWKQRQHIWVQTSLLTVQSGNLLAPGPKFSRSSSENSRFGVPLIQCVFEDHDDRNLLQLGQQASKIDVKN